MITKQTQLTLPIEIDDKRNFDNYVEGSNARLIEHLKDQLDLRLNTTKEHSYSGIILWGAESVGKTHLLSALAQQATNSGQKILWLQADLLKQGPVENVIAKQIYLLDDLENFIVDSEAEQSLLGLIERTKQAQALLLITTKQSLNRVAISLEDLSSRLKALDNFELIGLDEAQKREVLQQRALQRGIILSDEVVSWLFTHTSRDLALLLNLLAQIDTASLAQKRKVTIPLIKSILEVG